MIAAPVLAAIFLIYEAMSNVKWLRLESNYPDFSIE